MHGMQNRWCRLRVLSAGMRPVHDCFDNVAALRVQSSLYVFHVSQSWVYAGKLASIHQWSWYRLAALVNWSCSAPLMNSHRRNSHRENSWFLTVMPLDEFFDDCSCDFDCSISSIIFATILSTTALTVDWTHSIHHPYLHIATHYPDSTHTTLSNLGQNSIQLLLLLQFVQHSVHYWFHSVFLFSFSLLLLSSSLMMMVLLWQLFVILRLADDDADVARGDGWLFASCIECCSSGHCRLWMLCCLEWLLCFVD